MLTSFVLDSWKLRSLAARRCSRRGGHHGWLHLGRTQVLRKVVHPHDLIEEPLRASNDHQFLGIDDPGGLCCRWTIVANLDDELSGLLRFANTRLDRLGGKRGVEGCFDGTDVF